MRRLSLVIFGVSLVLGAKGANAISLPKLKPVIGCAISFAQKDREHRGYITYERYAAEVMARTEFADPKGGKSFEQALMAEARRLDTDHDGRISRAEYARACP